MDEFWANMIINHQAKLSDIKGKARKINVTKLLQRYLEEGKLTQEEFDYIMNENQ